MDENGKSAILGDIRLSTVEAAVRRALQSGSDEGLDVLGYGEISLVVGWPTGEPVVACKRLPPFRSLEQAERYHELFNAYLVTLTSRGVDLVDTEFHLETVDEDVIGYVVQPVLPARSLGPRILSDSDPDPDHELLTGIIDAVLGICDEQTGLDGQVSNWALVDGSVKYLDVTTPMSLDASGMPMIDMAVFLAAFPWALRGVLGRFVAPGIVRAYSDPRHVLVDLTANLIKERLDGWAPAVVEAANRRLDRPISIAEAEKFYRSDARMWEALSRLRRADRWWQRSVRRRPYPFLLPGRVSR